MPPQPQRQHREAERAATPPPPPTQPPLAIATGTAPVAPAATPTLPNHRLVAIARLTGEARKNAARMQEIAETISALNTENATLRRRHAAIHDEIRVHAWDGEPLPF